MLQRIQPLIVLSILAATLAHSQAIDYLKKGSAGDIRVMGEKRDNVEVLIRTVNDSDVLWTRGYNIGRKAWVGPGENKLSVMCVFKFDWGEKSFPGEVDFLAEQGKQYQIVIDPPSVERQECNVQVAGG